MEPRPIHVTQSFSKLSLTICLELMFAISRKHLRSPARSIPHAELPGMEGQSQDAHPFSFSHDPYFGLPGIGIGLTGLIYDMGEDRERREYINEMNRHFLENEFKIYERLGNYKGIIHCFRTSMDGIELAFAQDNLESNRGTQPEPDDGFSIDWMSNLIETFAYVHSCDVFVDDIAIRNILVLNGQLKPADLGRSILLPLEMDLYSIASWHIHKSYIFGPENPDLHWLKPDSSQMLMMFLCGKLIRKCWHGEYGDMNHVNAEAHQMFIDH
ncbi:hypothetical protein BDV12DRAFT_209498 [Aspergillus spectabilis]